MEEHLTKTVHEMEFACESLREALHGAGNVEAVVLLDLIRRANELRRDVTVLLAAHAADTTKTGQTK